MSQLMNHTSVIPAYNGGEHIGKTLECLIGQEGLLHHRIVVSDDVSKDDTGDIVRQFQEKIAKNKNLSQKIKIDYFLQNKNLGMVGNWNWVLDQVRTETFTLISQDDLLGSKDALIRCKQLMAEDKNLVAIYSNVELIDTEDRHLMMNILRKQSGYFDPALATKKSVLSSRNSFGLPLCVSTQLGGDVRYSPDVLYAADVDYAARLSLGGNYFDPADHGNSPLKSYHINEPLFVYRVHIASATSKVQKHSRNDFKIIQKATNIPLNSFEKMRFEVSHFLSPKLRALVLKLLSIKSRLARV